MMNMKNSTVTLDLDGKPSDLHQPGALQALFEYRRRQYAGWTMEDDDDDDDDQDDDDDDLDDDDTDDDDDDDDDEDLTPAQQRAIERAANRIADRRINQALRRDRRRRGNRRDDDDDDRGGRGGRGGNGRGRGRAADDEPADGVDPADAREARLAYREALGEHLPRLARVERPLAQAMSQAAIHSALEQGADVNEAGEQAAEAVARRLKRYRRTVQTETIERLQREGHLPKEFEFKSQPKRGREKPGRTKPNGETGVKIAESLYADRIPKK